MRTNTSRWAVLAVCCLSLLLVSLDVTIVNVALPDIRAELGAALSGLQWTIDGYTLVLASLLMLGGSLGDRLGRRKVFRVGLMLFTAASLLCGFAPTLGWLIGFRVLQAIGGSMLNPIAMAIVVNVFDDPKERAKAIGVWASVAGLSMALGPVLGGALVAAAGWRAIFWVNVPIGVIALVLTVFYVPESRAPHARAADPAGQALVIAFLGLLTFGIIEAPFRGWQSPVIIGALAGAVIAVAALVAVERRVAEPLVDTRFFRSVTFAGASIAAVVAFVGLSGFLFLNTLYLQETRGFGPLHAGLLTLPMAGAAALCAPIAGRIVASRGARLPLVLSGVSTASGAAMLVSTGPGTRIGWLLGAYALIGIGFGLVNTPITNAATSGMPRTRAGVAAAMTSTGRQTGSCLGVAVVGALAAGGSGRTGWLLIAGCGVLVTLLGIIMTGRWAARTADRTRHLLDSEEPLREPAAA
jgi:EmrB/QacA subfamily drug resistance transporter